MQQCFDPRRLSVFTPAGLALSVPVASVAAFRTGWHACVDPQMTVRQHAAETAAAFADDMEVFGWALQMIEAAPARVGASPRLAHFVRMADARGASYLSVDVVGGPGLILLGD